MNSWQKSPRLSSEQNSRLFLFCLKKGLFQELVFVILANFYLAGHGIKNRTESQYNVLSCFLYPILLFPCTHQSIPGNRSTAPALPVSDGPRCCCFRRLDIPFQTALRIHPDTPIHLIRYQRGRHRRQLHRSAGDIKFQHPILKAPLLQPFFCFLKRHLARLPSYR